MNDSLDTIISKFVKDVRRLSPFEAVQFDLFIGTNEHTSEFKYMSPTQLDQDSIKIRNLNGAWISND